MIVGKASVLQKPRLFCLVRPALRLGETEAADSQLAGPLRPILARGQGRFDQRGIDAALHQLALYAQRTLPALGVLDHVLLRVAFIVEVAALDELIDDALHRCGLEALGHERLAQLARADVASRQQHHGSGTYRRCIGGTAPGRGRAYAVFSSTRLGGIILRRILSSISLAMSACCCRYTRVLSLP